MSGEARKSTIYSSQLSKRGRSSMQAVQQQQPEEMDTELTNAIKEKQQLIEKNEVLSSENARLSRDIKKLGEKNKSDHELMYKVDYENLEYKQQKKDAEKKSKELKECLEKQEIESKTLKKLVKKLKEEFQLTLHSKNPFEGSVTQHKKPSGMWLEDMSSEFTEAEKQKALDEDSARREAQKAHEALAQLIRNNSNLN